MKTSKATAMQFIFCYVLGMYMISHLAGHYGDLADVYYNDYMEGEEVYDFRSIIFGTAVDMYSFTYLFYRVQTSPNSCEEITTETGIHFLLFIVLTFYGVFTFFRGNGFPIVLICSSGMGILISFATLAISHNFNVLTKPVVKCFRYCSAIFDGIIRRRNRNTLKEFAPQRMI